MTKQVSTATIYLGTPFYNDDQRARVKKAMALLEKNPTVVRVHFPFDQNFVDPEEKNPEIGGIRSMTWRLATYNNDITGLVNASCGVFLYDMDNIDDGSAFELLAQCAAKPGLWNRLYACTPQASNFGTIH